MSVAKSNCLRYLRKMLLFSGDGASAPQMPDRSAVDFDPCPRCGKNIEYTTSEMDWGGPAYIRCRPCGIYVQVKVTGSQMRRCALEQWNYVERGEANNAVSPMDGDAGDR